MKLVVVLPAFNAESTLERTYKEIPFDVVDEVILVDDCSSDATIQVANSLGINYIIKHDENKGYGGNQKTCYNKALELNPDIVIMLHPDYQYTPRLISAMGSLIAWGVYPVVLGSRTLGKGALEGGMPAYKYLANRLLTAFQNLLLRQNLSEYHTGYRAFSAAVLKQIHYERNSDNFVFDNEVISQIFMAGHSIAEISCPTHYFEEASSIRLKASINYGLGVIRVSVQHMLHRLGWARINRYL